MTTKQIDNMLLIIGTYYEEGKAAAELLQLAYPTHPQPEIILKSLEAMKDASIALCVSIRKKR